MIVSVMSSLQESDRGTNGGLKLLLLPKLEHKSLENKQCMGSTLTVTASAVSSVLILYFSAQSCCKNAIKCKKCSSYA